MKGKTLHGYSGLIKFHCYPTRMLYINNKVVLKSPPLKNPLKPSPFLYSVFYPTIGILFILHHWVDYVTKSSHYTG